MIHVATYPNAKMVKRNVQDATDNMVTATANILDLCVKHQVEKITFASSSMVYGEFNNQIPDETGCKKIKYSSNYHETFLRQSLRERCFLSQPFRLVAKRFLRSRASSVSNLMLQILF